ncbi:hypothetical protein BJD80_gp037 [Mycobacterium phage Catalina]|uniref:Uncharacterized protein n=1 Tax=Mycobacterium phage Catalina TaxID=1792253 RepID=A0A127KP91_9CAUD|nr:hypothetical protein BJD80_gp037 [Mycobacterium phage Catalina]AMO43841.1 hypothetical protein PBI_CATALINA_74 [Mycobacterium phage Catalina]
MKVRLKISEQEALVVKDALQRHAFDAGWVPQERGRHMPRRGFEDRSQT